MSELKLTPAQQVEKIRQLSTKIRETDEEEELPSLLEQLEREVRRLGELLFRRY